MKPFVSVVIPSYNIKSRLELNLSSFFGQTYAPGRFEVIVVDDGSTDGTSSMCQGLNTPYTLKVLNTGKNSGRSRARNLGVSVVEGDLIIFCDGDTIQPPEFIENHVINHTAKENLVLGSLPLYWVLCFTHYHSDFSGYQKELFFSLNSGLRERYEGVNEAKTLEPETLIADFESVRRLCVYPGWNEHYFEIIDYFKTFSAIPTSWMCFLTGNVSLPRQLFIESGGFDENYRHWGFEDWDLGYRLKVAGACCDCQKDVLNFHQEHPRPASREKSSSQNYSYFCSKYNKPELYLLSKTWSPLTEQQWNLFFYNKLVSQYQNIASNEKFNQITSLFNTLVQADFSNRLLGEEQIKNIPLNKIKKTKEILERFSDSHKEFVTGFLELIAPYEKTGSLKGIKRRCRKVRSRKLKCSKLHQF